MQRTSVVLTAVLALALALPASADPPFGQFGGRVGGGNGGAGVVPLHGWALDDDGVAAVDIVVDGMVVGRAKYGRSRPGVPQGFPDSDGAGFAFRLDTTRFLNGLHTVTARVRSLTGEVVDLEGRTFEFTNVTQNLIPFGEIEFPNRDAELFGACNLTAPRRYSVISGFALDVGVEVGDQGVGYVELLIDGAQFANSAVDCTFDLAQGGLTNCYGLRRLDIARTFPGLSDSLHGGYRFVLDVGALIAFGYPQGRRVLTVRAGDISGQVADIDEIPVTFGCVESLGNEDAIGKIERPRDGLIYSGVVEAVGWALDAETVLRVLVYVDGFYVGDATYGLPRPGVSQLYPGFPDSLAPGWSFPLDTTQLANGDHELQVVVRDSAGLSSAAKGEAIQGETLIGERRFVVFNP